MVDDGVSLPPSSTEKFGLHKGDSRQLQKNIGEIFGEDVANSEFIDVTITSPPYADMIEYETDPESQVGFGDGYEEYLEDLRTIFKQIYDLTSPEGSLWIVVNSFREKGRFIDLPGDIVQLCENLGDLDLCPNCGQELSSKWGSMNPRCRECEYSTLTDSWRHHDTIIWDKVRARPYAKNTFRNVFEYILCFTKSENPKFEFDNVRIADESQLEQWWVDWPERYNPRGKIPDNTWEMTTPIQGGWNRDWPGHPAPFPPELVERIVHLTTNDGDVVFDPFGGSGTTVAQSLLMGRRSFGFEISDIYLANFEAVFEYLRELWEERRQENDTLELQQQRLERTIWALRELIYAKKAATKLWKDLRASGNDIDSIGDVGLHSIVVDSGYPNPSTVERTINTMETKYTYAFDSGVDGTQYLDQLSAMTTMDPWNGFEIDPTISTRSIEEVEFTDLPGDNGGPYLYTYGKHEHVARALSKAAWTEARSDSSRWRSKTASKHCPALISNLFVTVERNDGGPQVSEQLLEDPPDENGIRGVAHIQDSDEHVDTSLSDYF